MRRSPVWSPSSCQSEAPALVGIAHLGVRSFPLLAHEQPATGTGLHVARRPHPDIVPERAHLACPIVPLGTRLDADPTDLIVPKNGSTRDRLRRCRTTTSRGHQRRAPGKPTLLCRTRPPRPVPSLSSRSSVAAHAAPWVESRPRIRIGPGTATESHSPGRPPIGTFVRFSYSLGIYSMRAIASDRLPKLASAKPDSLGSKRPAGGALSGRPSPSSAWPSGPGNSKSLADTLL